MAKMTVEIREKDAEAEFSLTEGGEVDPGSLKVRYSDDSVLVELLGDIKNGVLIEITNALLHDRDCIEFDDGEDPLPAINPSTGFAEFSDETHPSRVDTGGSIRRAAPF